VIARLLRLIAVLLAGLLLGVAAFAALIALGVVRNPLDPVIGGDIALARSARPGQRVLFVGNSLTYYHNMPGMVGRLAAADPGPKPLIVVSYTRGAAHLSDFAGDGGLGRLLHEVRWDDVVLQEQSMIPSLPPAERAQQMDPAARRLSSLINAAGARTLLFMTAGYEHGNGSGDSYQAMQLRLAQGYAAVGSEIGADVVPVGAAWEQAHLRQPDLGLWSWDGTHPSTAGSYLDACVFYAALTGRSPVGNPYTAGLDLGQARFLQQMAAGATA
jgi:lysophospholipase L1-like esterase